MMRSAERTRRWVRTLVGFSADLVLYTGVGLVLWLAIPAIVLGWQPIMITSGSMSPSVEPGDVLLIERGVPESGEWFVPGTIITYEDTRPATAEQPAETRLVTHRVNNINIDGEYVTRGDANASLDQRPVASDQVVGAARLLLPWLGLPVHWTRQGQFVELTTFVLVLIAAILASRLEDDEELDRLERVRRQELDRQRRPNGLDPLTLGSRAAGAARAGSGSGRLRPLPTLEDLEVVEPRRRTAGLPPVAAFLVAVALAIGGFVPAAQAAFSDETANTGNSFATAPAPAVPPSMVLPPFDDDGTPLDIIDDADPNPGQWASFTYGFTFEQDLALAGVASTRLRAQRVAPGNSPASINVTLRADGVAIAAGSISFTGNGWQTLEFDLDDLGPIDATLPATTAFEVELDLRRVRIDVGSGESEILLPLVD